MSKFVWIESKDGKQKVTECDSLEDVLLAAMETADRMTSGEEWENFKKRYVRNSPYCGQQKEGGSGK